MPVTRLVARDWRRAGLAFCLVLPLGFILVLPRQRSGGRLLCATPRDMRTSATDGVQRTGPLASARAQSTQHATRNTQHATRNTQHAKAPKVCSRKTHQPFYAIRNTKIPQTKVLATSQNAKNTEYAIQKSEVGTVPQNASYCTCFSTFRDTENTELKIRERETLNRKSNFEMAIIKYQYMT